MEDDTKIDLSFLYKEKTPEEIEEEKRRYWEELAQKGFLPLNDELEETSHSTQEEVEQNPKKYIIEECIPACQELWKRNIYTFMVSDHLNENVSWIEVIFDSLSEENKKILQDLSGDDVIKFSYHKGCANFGVNKVGKEGQERLKAIAQKFKMQDVPANLAYITPDKFLFEYCGCYDEIPNPDYIDMLPPSVWTLESGKEYLDWMDSERSKKTIRKFNPNKRQKPVKELADEKGMIIDEKKGRVYLSSFHYAKHQNYERYIESIQPSL